MLTDLINIINKYRHKRPEPLPPSAAGAPEAEKFSATAQKNITIAICNQKGGCAKTTTAINLSAWLAEKGCRVLLIDLDPQAHASLGLGVDIENIARSVYDVLINSTELADIIQPTTVKNLEIAPANSLLSGAQIELTDVLGREAVFKTALHKLKLTAAYDFILLDCSPSLNLITINALVAADFILIPIQTQYYSLEGMRELFSTIEIIKERLNTDLKILGILPTLFDTRTKVSHQVLERMREYFKEMVFNTVVHANVRLCEAPMHKQPIHIYDPKSQGAKDYQDLSDEILVLTGHKPAFILNNNINNAVAQTQELNGRSEETA